MWPLISIERSLELLDYAYPDPAVRGFAIKCLHKLKWVFFATIEKLIFFMYLYVFAETKNFCCTYYSWCRQLSMSHI